MLLEVLPHCVKMIQCDDHWVRLICHDDCYFILKTKDTTLCLLFPNLRLVKNTIRDCVFTQSSLRKDAKKITYLHLVG